MTSLHVKQSTQEILYQKPPRNLPQQKQCQKHTLPCLIAGGGGRVFQTPVFEKKPHPFQVIRITERPQPLIPQSAKSEQNTIPYTIPNYSTPPSPFAIRQGRICRIIDDTIHVPMTSTATTRISNYDLFSRMRCNFSSFI